MEDRTRLTALFCQTVQDAGYKPMIYHNMEMATLMLDLGQLEQYDKWFAYYNDDLYYPYAYKVWRTEKRWWGLNKGGRVLRILFLYF